MSTEVVSGFIASSEYIPVYKRAVLSEDDIRLIFAQYQARGVSLIGNHDERNVVDGRVLSVELRRTGGGGLGVWVEVEVEEGLLAQYHGWSIGWFENNYQVSDEDPRPIVKFGADAFHFTDEEREEVAAVLAERFKVVGGRYFQLGIDPPATVVLWLIDETLKGLPSGVLVALLMGALGRLLPKGSRSVPTLFKFSVLRTPEATETRGVVETSEIEVLRDALAGLKDLADNPPGHYELDGRVWRPVGQQSSAKKVGGVDKRGKHMGSSHRGKH